MKDNKRIYRIDKNKMEKTIKTLIVDDDNIVRTFLMKLIINKFGYDVVQAGNGIEALRSLEHDDPDIVFLDISMPLMNGIEFLSTVRTQAKYKNLPIVAITAHSDKETVKKLVELGIQDYILKPLSYNETYARLREIIAGYKGMINKNRNDKAGTGIAKSKKLLLLIDADYTFRNFLKRLLSFEFDIIEGISSAECLDLFVKHDPEYVITSLELNATRENFLLNKLKDLDVSGNVKIFATTFNEHTAKNAKGYEGVMLKSFFPSRMMVQISSVFLKHDNIGATYNYIIKNIGLEKLEEVIKYVFDLEAGLNIVSKNEEIFASRKGEYLNNAYFSNSDDTVYFNLSMNADQNFNIPFKNKHVSSSLPPESKIGYITNAVADYMRYEFEKYGIDLTRKTDKNLKDDIKTFTRQVVKYYFESDHGDRYECSLSIFVKK